MLHIVRKETRYPVIFSAGVDNKVASRPRISASLCKTLSRKASEVRDTKSSRSHEEASYRPFVTDLSDHPLSDAKWQRTAIRISRLFPTCIATQLTDVVYEGVNRSDRGCSINPINSCVRAATTPMTTGRSLTMRTMKRKRTLAKRKPPKSPCMIPYDTKDPWSSNRYFFSFVRMY